MIERKFVSENIREFRIQEYVRSNLKGAGLSHIKMQKTPLGEKITVHTSRPGLVVGRKGETIKQLTKTLKKEFELENPQIEIAEVGNVGIDAAIMAEKVADYLEKFGIKNFKGIGHKIMTEVMNAGALGIEIKLSGKIPSSRAKSWRFYSGYLKKCGDISIEGVNKAYAVAQLKSGIVGIKVSIMPPGLKLPDNIEIIEAKEEDAKEDKPKEGSENEEALQERQDKEVASDGGKNEKSGGEVKKERKPRKRKAKEEKDESQGDKVNGQ